MSFQKAIVVGASSGIGEAIAVQLAKEGATVALVARRESELRRVAALCGVSARTYPHDVMQIGDVPALFEQICRDLNGLDLIVYASGVMPSVAPDEFNTAKDETMISVNVSGAVAWLNPAAYRFQAAGEGTIVGLGSVAGDRGRRVSPVYGATKAALETYLESLRNRLSTKGVRVVTIKPGPVRTPMTENLGKMPFMIEVDDAARQILRHATRGTNTAYVPGVWRVVMGVIRTIPSFVFRRLDI